MPELNDDIQRAFGQQIAEKAAAAVKFTECLDVYESASAEFALINREYNRAKRAGKLTDEIELKMFRAQRALAGIYAAQAKASPDTSTEKEVIRPDGSKIREKLSAAELSVIKAGMDAAGMRKTL